MVLYLMIALIGVLVVGGAVVGVRAAGRGRAAAEPIPGTREELRDRIRALCAEGRQIEAVKLTRQALPGVGLHQAKQLVDTVAAGGEIPFAPGATAPRLPPALHERVRRLLEDDRTLEAIKVVRQELPGMSLKAARDAVLAVGRGAPPAVGPSARPAIGEDLAARVRRLIADGRREQAIFLVRGETGMAHDEASAFVDAIEPRPASSAGDGERHEPPADDAGRD